MRLDGRRSLTFRVTLLFTSASMVVLLALGFLISELVERHFEGEDVQVLAGKLQLVRHALEKVHSLADVAAAQQQFGESLEGHEGLAVAVLGPGGRKWVAGAGADFPQPLLDGAAGANPRSALVWKQDDRAFRGIAATVGSGAREGGPVVVAVAMDITHHRRFMSNFTRTLWIFVAIAAAVTGLLGWVAARRGLAPLRAMERGAAAVTASRLDYRLPVDTVPVELAELARTLNEMLARLEDSFSRLSDFSSDLAHELRTPVSNLLTQTQVALSKPRQSEEYRQVLASNVEEFERLARMVSDMLFLARSDNGMIAPNREPVHLADEVRELFEFYEALAEENGVRLLLEGNGQVTGDRVMLRQALSNLLSNALRHTHAGGAITVRIHSPGDGAVRLAVENTGDPIAPQHLPRVFDRFYRVDPSRRHTGEGAGLGLAITRSIVRAHGGEIAVRSEGGVTGFEIRIPASAGEWSAGTSAGGPAMREATAK